MTQAKIRFLRNRTTAYLEKFIEHRVIEPEEDGAADLNNFLEYLLCGFLKTPFATFNFYLNTTEDHPSPTKES